MRRLRYQDCACGWKLPTIKVFGRIAHDYEVAGRQVSAAQVEEAVFELPVEHGVLFWRGQALDAGTIVPLDVLLGNRRTVKPRRFFGPDEDWDTAIITC